MSFKTSEVRVALFTSPTVNGNDQEDLKNNAALSSRLEIDHENEELKKQCQKDMHVKRMKKLRQMAKQLAEDDWLFPPIEKLIGLKDGGKK